MKKIALLIIASVLFLNPTFAQKPKLKVGKNAPSFDLPTFGGENKTLEGILAEKDYVLVHFFIGSWHSYDKAYRMKLQEIYPQLQAKNVEILAITRELPVFLKSLHNEIKFDYPIGLDTDWYTMSNYGVAVKITKNYVPLKHKEYSALNAKHIGSKDDMIPVPATFLINKEGKIIWMHYNPDYRRRPDLNKILEQL
jgi:peroxiredoxin